MAKRLIEIIAIAKGDKGKIFVAKKNRYYLESQVIKMVKQGYIFEVQNESGISTYFMVKKMKSGKEYLSTVPDQTERNNLRRITDLALILSKVGEPESPKSRVNGRIVLDTEKNKI